ncbi:LegC family aminotransferase [Roseibium sp. M-1]
MEVLQLDLEQAYQALRDVAGGDRFVPLHAPHFGGKEWSYVKECLDTGWVSSVGSYVDLFEQMLAEICGVQYAVATMNGTAALHIALLIAGVRPNDEVIVPTLTFIATANAVHYCRAVPHFVDSEWDTLGLDSGKLDEWLSEIGDCREDGLYNRQTGRRLAAVAPMHTFGHPVKMQELVAVCRKWDIPIVEDAAESLGSLYLDNPLGGWGLVGAVSFNGNKIITTGGGGAVLTNDAQIAKRAKHITTTAKVPHAWAFVHDEIGYNYRLPNINAALGCAQLEQLPRFLASKRQLAMRYAERLQSVEGLKFFREPENCESNYWLNAVILDEPRERDEFLQYMNAKGLMTRPCWTLMSELELFRHCPASDLTVARDISASLVNIPSSASIVSQVD